jgi:succinate dehydrogenase / fumarate reductase iron-sulfur subunit
MADTVKLKVKRQDRPDSQPYWQEFEVERRPSMNVISCLMDIQRKPVTNDGRATTPIVWDCSCLEEVCGVCTMVINGRVRQSCTALVDQLEQPISLEPMRKFPVVRDLCVDRSRMFGSLKKVKAWIPIDGTYDLGPGPRMNEAERAEAYHLSQCMTCGCCLDACPQVNDRSKFIGAAAIGQVVLFNSHPTGKMNKNERLDALLDEGGIIDCGNAQNCVRVCPKDIPLTWAIAKASRATTLRMFTRMFDL